MQLVRTELASEPRLPGPRVYTLNVKAILSASSTSQHCALPGSALVPLEITNPHPGQHLFQEAAVQPRGGDPRRPLTEWRTQGVEQHGLWAVFQL